MTRPRPLVGTLAAVAVVLGSGCAGGDRFDPQAGDCLRIGDADPATGPLTELTLVDCEEPHELEVFHTFELAADQIAGDARVAAVAEACLGDAFTAYVGVPADASPLELLPLPPTADQLAAGQRTVRCTVRPPGGGTTTGSVRSVDA